MSILLSNAVLLPLAVLVGVPLLIHLFARARPPVYPFPSVEFILRILRTTQRIKRPQNWILLLLRTLAFAALVGIFLQPLLFSDRRLAGPLQARNVVLIVDASVSMAYQDGAQSRFVAACTQAAGVLDGLSAGDRANLVWLRSPSQPAFPEMGVNFVYLRELLRKGKVSSEAGDARQALRTAVEMLGGTEGAREICIVSDFQKTTWPEMDVGVPEGIDVVLLPVGDSEASNQAVTRVYAEPAVPLAGEPVTIYCDVRNYSGQPRQTTVYLNAGEFRDRQNVLVNPWEKTTVVFPCRFDQPARYPVLVGLSEDRFPGDNQRRAVLDVRPYLSIGILAGEPTTATYWQRALDALGWVRVETLASNELHRAAACDLLMVSGWAAAETGDMDAYLDGGGTLVWSPAAGTPVGRISSLARTTAEDPDAQRPILWEQRREPYRLLVADPGDSAFRVFADGEYGDPSRGVIYGRLNLPANGWANAHELMRYADGVPALLRFESPRSLILWNLPLGPEVSDWAGRTEFLPLLAELILGGRASGRDLAAAWEFLPGQVLTRTLNREALASDLRVEDQDGGTEPLERQVSDAGVLFATERITEPGLFAWRLGDEHLGYSVVNFPSTESDLRTWNTPEIKASGVPTLGGGHEVRDLRDGMKLWPFLLAAAAALLLAEGAVTVWAVKT